MTDVSVVECDECGLVEISFDRERIMTAAEKHAGRNPEHQLYLHVMESKDSRKL